MSGAGSSGAALARLDEITRRLRRECPWDREQDERSIVPHTVEEAYELADAAHSGDDAKLLDELGDVLFQVYSCRCCSRSAAQGDLARGGRALPPEADPPPPARVRRASRRPRADEVLRNWDADQARRASAAARSSASCPRTCRPRSTRKQACCAAGVRAPAGRASRRGRVGGAAATSTAVGELLFAVVARRLRARRSTPSCAAVRRPTASENEIRRTSQ